MLLPAALVLPGPAFAQMAAAVPQMGLKTIPVVIRTAAGKTHRFTAELAASDSQQQIGMMYRMDVPRATGMLFPRVPPARVGFWMRNTYVPLDILYIAPGGRIESIVTAQPLDDRVLPSQGPVEATLEIGAGEAARLGIRAGDRVEWREATK